MTEADQNTLAAAQSQLRMAAIRYAVFFMDPAANPDTVRTAEYVLITAAHTFVSVIDQIDPKLWDQPQAQGNAANP